MDIELARQIGATIDAAVKRAEAAGETTIDLADVLRAAAHSARDELAEAITAAEAGAAKKAAP